MMYKFDEASSPGETIQTLKIPLLERGILDASLTRKKVKDTDFFVNDIGECIKKQI